MSNSVVDATSAQISEHGEKGYLLIADMEDSTRCKHELDDADAFSAVCEHNDAILRSCEGLPVAGIVLSSLGDSIVVKFPAGDSDQENARALVSCLKAAQRIIEAVSELPERLAKDQTTKFIIRTKLALQYYRATPYRWTARDVSRQHEIVGPDIDAAFRIADISWRFQVLVTVNFATELLTHSTVLTSSILGRHTNFKPGDLLAAAEKERETAPNFASSEGILVKLHYSSHGQTFDYWITDARTTPRLRGVRTAQPVFLIALDDPGGDLFDPNRRQIKLRQDHHAVIMVKVSIDATANEEYIDHIVKRMRKLPLDEALDSELTVCVAAKIFGAYDFFFRVSCADEDSLMRFFRTIRDDKYTVTGLEVRSTMPNHFEVNPKHARILDHFYKNYPDFQLVLSWFAPEGKRDLLGQFSNYIGATPDGSIRDVEVLEAGEVVHRTPVYALFVCRNLAAYSNFFREQGINPTTCETYIAANTGDSSNRGRAGVRLSYYLVNRIFLPRRRPWV